MTMNDALELGHRGDRGRSSGPDSGGSAGPATGSAPAETRLRAARPGSAGGEETFCLDQTVFMSLLHQQDEWGNALKKDEPVVAYVLSAFTEVCKKIDQIHSLVEKQPCLDTIVIEEAAETKENQAQAPAEDGWLRKLRQLLYGQEAAAPASDASDDEQREEIEEELSALKALVGEIKKVYWELLSETRRVEAETKFLREKALEYQHELGRQTAQADDLKARLRARQKELEDRSSALAQAAAKEQALSQTVRAVAARLCRLWSLLGPPPDAEALSQALLSGDAAAVESLWRELEQLLARGVGGPEGEQAAATRALEAANAELLRQLQAKEAELGKTKAAAERAREEQDAVINKQRLAIKYLQSQHPAAPGRPLAPSTVSTAPSKPAGTPRLTAKRPPAVPTARSSPFVAELSARIGSLTEKLRTVNQAEPQFKKYLEEINDCKRRLADFLQIYPGV